MSQFDGLPDGWIKTTLKEIVLTIQYGYTASAREDRVGPRLLRITDLQNNSVDWDIVPFCECDGVEKYALKKGDIVIARTGATTGKSFLLDDLPEETIFASYLIRLSTSEIFPPKYVGLFLQSPAYWDQITVVSKGTAQPGANAKILSGLDIPLPPLNEQRRIVEKIEALTVRSHKARAALDEIPALLDQFRQSVLAAAFRGDLTADWRAQNPDVETADALLERIRVERRDRWEEVELEKMKAKGEVFRNDKWKGKYKEPKNLEESTIVNLRQLPETWCWLTWEEILSVNPGAFKRGPFGSTLKKSIFVSSGYKVYEQYCPINDDCSYARYYITPDKFEELKSFSVKSGDFLISCSGVTLGRITQIPDNYEEGVINQALLRVRLHDSVMLGKYFIWLFRSPFFQKKIFENATGSAIPNVKGVDELKAIPIPLPPIREQDVIIDRVLDQLKAIDEIEKIFQEAEVYLNELDQSILAKAFRGELVPQDPNDEPAAVLLDRIRAERERLGSGKKRAKAKA